MTCNSINTNPVATRRRPPLPDSTPAQWCAFPPMRILHFPLVIALLVPVLSLAQDDSTDNAIHAVTELHEDGTKTVTVTDPDKHSSESTTYTANEKIIERVVCVLDDNNSPVSGTIYGPDNQPAFKAIYKHDDFNRLVEEDDFTLDDQLMRRFTYDFGPDGKVVRVHAFDSQGNELQQSDARKDESQVPPRVHH
jgi:hypothetical protein